MPGTKRSSAGTEKGDASKKPSSEGYQLFRDEKKRVNSRELVRNIIHQWENMDEDKKQHYENMAKKKEGGENSNTGGKKTRSKAASSDEGREDLPEDIATKDHDPRNESTESGITEGEASIQPEQIELGFIEKDVVALHGGKPEEEEKIGKKEEVESNKSTTHEPPAVEKTFSEKKTRGRRIPVQTA